MPQVDPSVRSHRRRAGVGRSASAALVLALLLLLSPAAGAKPDRGHDRSGSAAEKDHGDRDDDRDDRAKDDDDRAEDEDEDKDDDRAEGEDEDRAKDGEDQDAEDETADAEPEAAEDEDEAADRDAGAASKTVEATAETDPVPHASDAADDPAIWVNTADPAASRVIGTDKDGGLGVYDLQGRQLSYLAGGNPNNVDLREGFPLGGKKVTLVAASDEASGVLLYRLDASGRRLQRVGSVPAKGLYGLCMYHGKGGAFYAIGTTKEGPAHQWRLAEAGSGKVAGDLVRTLQVGSTSEGCAADDELDDLYIAEEQGSLWRYAADPGGGAERTAIDAVTTEGGTLEGDIEGVEVAYKPDGQGHVVVSSQGSNEYVLYDRAGDHQQVGRFTIADGAVDGTDDTDGLDVVTDALGTAFPEGLLVVQDGSNDNGNQNFKLVPWNAVVSSGEAATPDAPEAAPEVAPLEDEAAEPASNSDGTDGETDEATDDGSDEAPQEDEGDDDGDDDEKKHKRKGRKNDEE